MGSAIGAVPRSDGAADNQAARRSRDRSGEAVDLTILGGASSVMTGSPAPLVLHVGAPTPVAVVGGTGVVVAYGGAAALVDERIDEAVALGVAGVEDGACAWFSH